MALLHIENILIIDAVLSVDMSTLDVFFCQIKSFIRFCLAFFWALDPFIDKFY